MAVSDQITAGTILTQEWMDVMLGHYIPPRDFHPVEKEFIAPNNSDYFIWWLFKYKCIMCRRPATEINEINLRSRSKKNILDWRNRVTLCQGCHRAFHHNGVTEQKIIEMQKKRREFLVSIGRDEYVWE